MRAVALLPDPAGERLVGLATAQRLPGELALAFLGHVGRAALQDLDQVPAER